MSAADTLAEIRRIAAGGQPRKIRRGTTYHCSATRLNWKANATVLRLLGRVEAR